MKILILGGNRFIGKQVAEKLSLVNNLDVYILNRSGTGPSKCKILKCNRDDLTIHEKYDIIIDFCLYKEYQARQICLNLNNDQKYIFISSAAAYKNNNCLLYNESMPNGGLIEFGAYGKDKALCENVITSSHLNYIILRPPYIIGPTVYQHRLNYYFNKILKNEPINVSESGDKILSFIWMNDIIDTIVDMTLNFGDYKTRETYNVVSENFYSQKTLASEIGLFLDLPILINENKLDAPFMNVHLMLSPLKLNKKFSTIKENLSHFYEWYKCEFVAKNHKI